MNTFAADAIERYYRAQQIPRAQYLILKFLLATEDCDTTAPLWLRELRTYVKQGGAKPQNTHLSTLLRAIFLPNSKD